jgi:hypothetical protein
MLEEAKFRGEEIDERQASHIIDEGQELLEQAKFCPDKSRYNKLRSCG